MTRPDPVLEMRRAGAIYREIAAATGLPIDKICDLCIDAGLGGRRSYPRKINDALALQLRRDGATFAAIGKHFSASTVAAIKAVARAKKAERAAKRQRRAA